MFSNGSVAVFLSTLLNKHDAMKAFTLSAARRRKPLVILSSLNIETKYSTSLSVSSALSKAGAWLKCNCTPRRIIRAIFSAKASTAVACVCVAAMWWHVASIADADASQRAVGFDALLAMPWALVWAFRATRMSLSQEGGEL